MARREPKGFLRVSDRVSIFLRGKIWQVNYQLDGRQVRASLKTSSKKEAQRKAGEIDRKLTRGENPQAAPPVELATVIEWCMKDLRFRCRKTSMEKYELWSGRIREFAAERGVRYIAQVTPLFADEFRDRYAIGLDYTTLYSGMRLLRSLVLFAYRRQLCDVDTLANYKVPKPRHKPQPCWSPEQADQIVAAASPEFQPYFLFLRETGCRTDEGRFLTWADVNFGSGDGKRAYIHIRAKEGWQPKSGEERKVPMTARLAEMLRALPRHGEWVFRYQQRSGQWTQMDNSASQRDLRAILKRLNLKGRRHTFRHTYISQALMNRVPEAVVREWAGHVDQRILKLYTHVAPAVSDHYLKLFESRSSGDQGDATAAAS